MKKLGLYIKESLNNDYNFKGKYSTLFIWGFCIVIFRKYIFLLLMYIVGVLSMAFPIRCSKTLFIVPISKEDRIKHIKKKVFYRRCICIVLEIVALLIAIFIKKRSNIYILLFNFMLSFLIFLKMTSYVFNINCTNKQAHKINEKKLHNVHDDCRVFGAVLACIEIVLLLISCVFSETRGQVAQSWQSLFDISNIDMLGLQLALGCGFVILVLNILYFALYGESQIEYYIDADIWLGNQEKSE